MTAYLRARTVLPVEPIVRQHAPRTQKYKRYRSCLRWEFAFRCCICLLHETDYDKAGAEKLHAFTVEHYHPQSVAAELANVYGNLLYVCRPCNAFRNNKPARTESERQAARLLNPCQHAWADHFAMVGFKLEPRSGDLNAQYTADAYQVNSPSKQVRRRIRWERHKRAAERVIAADDLLKQMDRFGVKHLPHVYRVVVAAADALRRAGRDARHRYPAVPFDAPQSCRCQLSSGGLRLPEWVAPQLVSASKSDE